jgi:hypothetical protein
MRLRRLRLRPFQVLATLGALAAMALAHAAADVANGANGANVAVGADSAVAAELDGPAVLRRATAAAGGEDWANARTLMLVGRAEFWGAGGAAPRSRADAYVMWRVFDPARAAAHGAEGKLRIIATSGGRPLFTVGFDGQTTWTERGITPAAEAEAFWASNFGFGIIRHALKPGYKAERVADRGLDGHALYMVRLTDPAGGVTLFGVDQASHAIRLMGFTTPRGWHERHYDDFVAQDNPRWLQARRVTLYYNGVKQNEVFWDRFVVNGPVDDAVFAPPAPPAPPAR